MTSKTRRIIGISPISKRESKSVIRMPLKEAEAIVRKHRQKYGKYSVSTDVGKWHHREKTITKPTKNPREYTKVRKTTKIWDLLFP